MRDLNSEDPTAYVISANIHRRHMTKAGRAIAVAMVYPVAKPGPSEASRSAKNSGISSDYVRMARTIVAHVPDLAREVMAGTEALDAAYKVVSLHPKGGLVHSPFQKATSTTIRSAHMRKPLRGVP